ncbi:NAD(P)-dependent oxidoreductase [Fusibacter paucivorans]|uniref:NAD(P)-dependent oxidoreductase n=1 Tax=Fusibacter paucivorans TaxID=76009 RepID=A0ABS5PQD5_9FIRM|nr:NAD(P)-dependent oxidoreductase [Fusibacter paucivorans]MBS7526801.1 NAD(P)-dependent oxidoreductase [Fusibacter paucivorans]
MKVLVGYTGFVGGNLKVQTAFDAYYNSKNIREAFGLKPDLLVYCGVKAEKYMAIQNPEADRLHIEEAMANISAIAPKKIVLISTIDVYPKPLHVDEATMPSVDAFDKNAYGKHRLMLEAYVREHFDALIVRLPALFGLGLKKNFIYDLSHPIPTKLSASLYHKLSANEAAIAKAYTLDTSTNFYVLKEVYDAAALLEAYEHQQFSSLHFTDSRAVFQFYPLNRLWQDIETALSHQLTTVNLATEPLSISEIHERIKGKPYLNEKDNAYPIYDLRTKYAAYYHDPASELDLLHRAFPYLMTKETVLDSIEMYLRGDQ